jgi:hypothetical protein
MNEQLQEARRLIAKGWCKRMMHRRTIFGGHKYCADGALGMAFMGSYEMGCHNWSDEAWQAFRLVTNALASELGFPAPQRGGLIELNDNSLTRKQHVLNAFDEAIRLTQPVIEEPSIELPVVTKELVAV